MSFEKALKKAETLDINLVPYELAKDMKETRQRIDRSKPGQSVGILLAPEGGFAEEEIQAAAEKDLCPLPLADGFCAQRRPGWQHCPCWYLHWSRKGRRG